MKRTSNFDLDTRELERKLRGELREHEKEVELIKWELSDLYKSKLENKGQEKVKLKDKELAFIISTVLSKKLPATKAVQNCSVHFDKPGYWAKKVIRFKPLPEQVKRAFNYLNGHDNPEIKILTKHCKLRISDIMNKSELPGFLRKLKVLQKMAEELEANALYIKLLNNKVVELKKESASKDLAIEQFKRSTAEERVNQLRTLYPEKSVAKIARLAGVSRTTVYKYSEK